MTSRERVLTAFARQEPDRVPLDYAANPGIDKRLKVHFRLKDGDDEGLLQALGTDFRYTYRPNYIGPKLFEDKPGCIVNEWAGYCRWIKHETGGYWDYCDFPLKDAALEEIEQWPMPSPDQYDYTGFAAECRRLRDYAVVVGGQGIPDIINGAGMVRTMEQTLLDMALEEPAFLRYVERRLNVHLEVLARALEMVKKDAAVFYMGEDLGTQRGPSISLEMYRKLLKPWHKKFVDLARHHGLPVMIHSCGSSSWAFEDFIEMGIGVIDTLQPEAKDMSPRCLKDTFGDRLAFHGCISTAGPLACGTVKDVEDNVRETLEIMMPGGGYALAPTHYMQDNTPTENVVAMYETARAFGQYGGKRN